MTNTTATTNTTTTTGSAVLPISPSPSIGNTDKLNGIRHFSISVRSCTYATEECPKYCYARRRRMAQIHTVNAYEKNYQLSQTDNFVSLMNKQLSNNERFFRIHAAGDFYSLEYFKKWCKIARSNPHISFLAYTRNPEVFKVNRPDNLKLIFSVDKTTVHKVTNAQIALVVPTKYKDRPHLSKLSKTDIDELKEFRGKFRVCTKNDCIHCLECWTGEDNIAFPQKL